MGSTTAKAIRYGPCVTRGHTVYLPPTHEPYLPLLPSRKASLPFGLYSLRLPTKGWPGWVQVSWPGWLGGYRDKCPAPGMNPDTVTHFSTNRARRWLTSLVEANALTTTPGHQQKLLRKSSKRGTWRRKRNSTCATLRGHFSNSLLLVKLMHLRMETNGGVCWWLLRFWTRRETGLPFCPTSFQR